MFGEKNDDILDKDNFLNARILLHGNISLNEITNFFYHNLHNSISSGNKTF